jgi:hypothetical protein
VAFVWLMAGALVIAGCTTDDDAAGSDELPDVDIDDEPPVDPVDPDDVVLVVATHDDALQAMADSLAAGSWRWSGGVEVTLTDEDYELMAADDGSPSIWEMRDESSMLGAYSARGALGEDGSWQAVMVHDRTDVVDFRMSGRDLLDASTLEPEVTVLLRVDWPYLLREMWAGFSYPGGPSPEEELAEVRREVEIELAGSPFLEVVLALLDGEWAGLAGVIDLASFGVTQEDLDEAAEAFREELIGRADRDTAPEMIDRSVTLRDFTAVGTDGGSVAVLDVHPQAAAAAIYDLFDTAEQLATDWDDEVPETLEGVATVTFDGDGMMTEVSTDVFEIMAQVVRWQLEHDPAKAGGMTQEDLELIDALDGTVAVVVRFSDHGNVPTVLDVPDPVLADWGELAELIAEEVERQAAWAEEWGEEWGDWDEDWEEESYGWDEDWEDWPDDGSAEPGSTAGDGGTGNANPGTRPDVAPGSEYEEFWDCVDALPHSDIEECEDLLP